MNAAGPEKITDKILALSGLEPIKKRRNLFAQINNCAAVMKVQKRAKVIYGWHGLVTSVAKKAYWFVRKFGRKK